MQRQLLVKILMKVILILIRKKLILPVATLKLALVI